jgi:lysophospholipase L1-like esterase
LIRRLAFLLLISCSALAQVTFSGVTISGISTGGQALHAFSGGGGINFGDSITAGTGASSPSTTSYRALLDTWIGGTFNSCTSWANCTPYAGGYGCGDIANKLHSHPQYGSSTNGTMMIGVNDANHNLADDQTVLAAYAACQKAIIAEFLPRTAKVYATDAGCTKTSGTWTADATGMWISGEALNSVVTSSILTCTITTTGNPIYIVHDVYASSGGSFTVTIDGVSKGTVATTASYYSTNSYTSSVALDRYVIAAGSHTVVMTTQDTNPVVIGFIASPPSSYSATDPIIWVAGVTKQSSGNSSTDPVTLDYNNTALANVTTMAGDNVRVKFVDSRSSVNTTTDMVDQFHFNDTGYNKINLAFQAVM